MAGQPVRYVVSDIANSSNVMLQSFYWRDTLPAEVRLDSIVTGTYNFPGTYKITPPTSATFTKDVVVMLEMAVQYNMGFSTWAKPAGACPTRKTGAETRSPSWSGSRARVSRRL